MKTKEQQVKELVEWVAEEIKIMQVNLTISMLRDKPSSIKEAEQVMLYTATKTAKQILSHPDLALIKTREYGFEEQVDGVIVATVIPLAQELKGKK